MFGWLKRLFGRAPKRRPLSRQIVRRPRGDYDAAQTTDDNRRHWANADALSAREANSREVRQILRMRSRHEAANHPYYRGMVSTLGNDLVGPGPRLQMLTDDPALNTAVEQAFEDWSKAVGLGELLRTMHEAKVVDGEAFAVARTNQRVAHPVKLDLELVDADRVTDPNPWLVDPLSTDGIVFDDRQNPIEYHILRHHPSDSASISGEIDKRRARDVIHWFEKTRPGQVRGIPRFTASLSVFAQMRRWTTATLTASEHCADFAITLETTGPANEADDVEPLDTLELDRGLMTTMPAGWKASQLKPEQPTATYSDFKGELLNESARPANMPLNVAAGNSSKMNFASGRLDHLLYRQSHRVERSQADRVVLDRIFGWFLEEARLVPELLPRSIDIAALRFRWMWAGYTHAVDPVKEAQADQIRLTTNTMTLAEIYADRGEDWEDALRQRAKEVALIKELGLAPAAPPPPASVDPEKNPDQDDEDETADEEEEEDAAT